MQIIIFKVSDDVKSYLPMIEEDKKALKYLIAYKEGKDQTRSWN